MIISPTPKKEERIIPRALSNLIGVLFTQVRMSIAAIHPEIKAPNKKLSVFFSPVSKKTRHIPGKAAWDTASPKRLCFLSTAYVPKAPLIILNMAEPNATTRNV